MMMNPANITFIFCSRATRSKLGKSKVRHSVYDMMNWWATKGVDGFRMDVINLISKPDGLPDANKNEDEKYANVEPLVSNGHRIHEFYKK